MTISTIIRLEQHYQELEQIQADAQKVVDDLERLMRDYAVIMSKIIEEERE